MKKINLVVIALVLTFAFQACRSGKKAYQKGNYYLAVIQSCEKLRNSPNNKKARKALVDAYPLAIQTIELNNNNLQSSSSSTKWTTIVRNYNQINDMYEEILRSPAALGLIPKPISRYDELTNAKNNAAEESYARGIVLLNKNNRNDAIQAFNSFLEAQSYVPNYRDTDNKLEEARLMATILVLVNQDPVPANFAVSGTYFNNKLDEYLHGPEARKNFIEYYRADELARLGLQADHELSLRYQEFTVGNVYLKEHVEQLTRDSVVVGYVDGVAGTTTGGPIIGEPNDNGRNTNTRGSSDNSGTTGTDGSTSTLGTSTSGGKTKTSVDMGSTTNMGSAGSAGSSNDTGSTDTKGNSSNSGSTGTTSSGSDDKTTGADDVKGNTESSSGSNDSSGSSGNTKGTDSTDTKGKPENSGGSNEPADNNTSNNDNTNSGTDPTGNNSSSNKNKVSICHEGKTLTINSSALQAHLAHGDYSGPCKITDTSSKGNSGGSSNDNTGKDEKKEEKDTSGKSENKGKDTPDKDSANDNSDDNEKDDSVVVEKADSGSSGSGLGAGAGGGGTTRKHLMAAEPEGEISNNIAEGSDPVYGIVKAILTTYEKTITSKALLSMTLTEIGSGRVLKQDLFPAEHIWLSKWGNFNGDERALSDDQYHICQQKELPAPSRDESFNLLSEEFYNKVTENIKRFYNNY